MLIIKKYVPAEEIAPSLGKAFPHYGIVMIRRGLPDAATAFVEAHECYHITDPAVNRFWREVKANWHAALKHPFGFVQCLWLSLTWERLSFYLRGCRERAPSRSK